MYDGFSRCFPDTDIVHGVAAVVGGDCCSPSNKSCKLFSKCRHKCKYLLITVISELLPIVIFVELHYNVLILLLLYLIYK